MSITRSKFIIFSQRLVNETSTAILKFYFQGWASMLSRFQTKWKMRFPLTKKKQGDGRRMIFNISFWVISFLLPFFPFFTFVDNTRPFFGMERGLAHISPTRTTATAAACWWIFTRLAPPSFSPWALKRLCFFFYRIGTTRRLLSSSSIFSSFFSEPPRTSSFPFFPMPITLIWSFNDKPSD